MLAIIIYYFVIIKSLHSTYKKDVIFEFYSSKFLCLPVKSFKPSCISAIDEQGTTNESNQRS